MNGMLQRIAFSIGLLASVIGSAQAQNAERDTGATIEPAQAQNMERNTRATIEPAQAQNMRADSLLAVDRNRGAVIEQIITQFKPNFAPGQEQMVRETLRSLRADHLLAASLAPNLDGLVAAMKAADTGVGAGPIKPKDLGDPTADLVYTPRTPCRLFDTRVSQGGIGPLVPGVTRTYSATAPLPQQGGPGGCTAPAGTAVAMIQLAAISPVGAGLLQGGASGTGPFANALLLYQPGDAHGTSIPMPVLVANGRFDLVALFNGVEVAGDLLGYFAEPEATALQCTLTTEVTEVHANGATFNFNAAACPAGFTRITSSCRATTFLGPRWTGVNINNLAAADCQGVNDTGGNITIRAGNICCRVPGR